MLRMVKKSHDNGGQLPHDKPADTDQQGRLVEQLFESHNETLVRFLQARLDSKEEAREVAQEAYVKLLQLDQPGAVSHFRAFLFRTAANLAIDRVRKRQLASKHQSLAFIETIGPPAEETEIFREKLRRVNRYLSELPPKCRKVFLLARLRGLSSKEIAAQMRLSERSVRNYILRAVEYCRSRLDEEMGDSNG